MNIVVLCDQVFWASAVSEKKMLLLPNVFLLCAVANEL